MKKSILVAILFLSGFGALHAQTRQTREEYIDRYKHIAVAHMERYGIPASITLAQGILESDCGNSALSRSSNNHFGIKCKSDWTGRRVFHDDDARGECFRAYGSVEASYEDHARFLDSQPRYDSLFVYPADDTTRIDGGYDGTIAVDLDHDRREVVIDDFSIPRAPYRLTDMTFFCRAEAILRYVLTTSDPIRTEFTPCGDGYRLRLDIDRDCVVEFWGRPYYNRPPRELFPEAEHSAYEIVFDSERMPRKLRREQTHQITVDSVFDVRIDYEPQAPLRLEAYYPDGYMLRKRKLRNQAKKPYDIVGRQAPDWTLVDADSTAVSLGDLRSRVLLIQFTGIGCGPCHASIPFLRSLEERYTPADVGVVAIETWGTPLRSIGVYVRRNRINYPMLAGTDETVDAYLPDRAVPVYLLVDAERRVRHAFRGYTPAESDRTITEAIDSLLHEQ